MTSAPSVSAVAKDEQPVEISRSPNAVSGISIILPCFNEEENIATAIAEATVAGRRCASDFEVIVVDDGSSDETAPIVTAIMRSNPHVRLLVHAHNRGYGDAVRAGIEAAAMDWVFLTDADLQFDLRELERFLPITGQADVVAGWRIQRRDPWHRRLNARMWNWLVRLAFDVPVRDVDCAFKLMRRELVRGCGLSCSGAMISTELLVELRSRGARIEEVGVHHHPRVAGDSSGARPHVVIKALKELVVLRHAVRQSGSAVAT